MRRVYVLEPGTYLRKDGDNLVVVKEGKVIEEVSFNTLTQLLLIGYIGLSGAVLNSLIVNRIETILLDSKGRFRGRLCIDEHKHVQRRMDQYLKLSNEDFALKTAKFIVMGKLRNQARLLSLKGSAVKDKSVISNSAGIRALSKEVLNVKDMDTLRGIEGHGSKLYFQGFGQVIKNKDFVFSGRNKRPPLDPVNALLSFVYTLLTNEVLTAIKVVGLDPYLGSLHAIKYGRPSLACDLVEEWRTILGDRLVLTLLNRRIIKKDDFVYRKINSTDFIDERELKQKRPVEIKPGICKVFLESYEKLLHSKILHPLTQERISYRSAILKQVELFKEYLMGNQSQYDPINLSYLR